jgi:preprotein translocase subunit YajC
LPAEANAQPRRPAGPPTQFRFEIRMTSCWQMLSSLALLAQDAAAPAAPAEGQPAGPTSIFESPLPMIALVMILFFFMVLRPQQREQKAREAMIKQIKKNDRVLTSSGIYGVVANIEAEAGMVTVRVDEKNDTKIRMTLSSIARVLGDETAEKSEKSEKS